MRVKLTKKEVENLYHKITWEGGISEYVIHYGGKLPDELKPFADKLETAYKDLRRELQKLYKEHGIGGF